MCDMMESVDEYLRARLSTSFEHYLLPGSYKALEHSFWRCRLVVGLRDLSGETITVQHLNVITLTFTSSLLRPLLLQIEYFAHFFLF